MVFRLVLCYFSPLVPCFFVILKFNLKRLVFEVQQIYNYGSWYQIISFAYLKLVIKPFNILSIPQCTAVQCSEAQCLELKTEPHYLENLYLFGFVTGVKYLRLDLLQRYKDETTFDAKCKVIVVRRMIEQSHDYRFNPLLMKGCHIDISKFCSGVVAKEPQDNELDGKVVKCLKVRIFLMFIFIHVISLHNYLQFVCILLSQPLTFQGLFFLLCCNI